MIITFCSSPHQEKKQDPGVEKSTEERHLTFMETWRIPLVSELSFTMFGIKLVRYCLYMWLPLYLHQNLRYDKSTAGYLSNAFEIGCVVGSPSLGESKKTFFYKKLPHSTNLSPQEFQESKKTVTSDKSSSGNS